MAESCTATRTDEAPVGVAAHPHAAALSWLSDEFPAWDITVDVTAGWDGNDRDLWVATRRGHHPQRELTAAKLHTRLDEYEERERRRMALAN